MLDILILFNNKYAISIFPHAIINAYYVLAQKETNVLHVNKIPIDHLVNFSALAQQILKKTKIINVFQIVKISIVLLVIVKINASLVLTQQRL